MLVAANMFVLYCLQMKLMLSILGVVTAIGLIGLLVVGLSRSNDDTTETVDETTTSGIGPNQYQDLFQDDDHTHSLDGQEDDHKEEDKSKPQTYPETEVAEWQINIGGADIKSTASNPQITSASVGILGSATTDTIQDSVPKTVDAQDIVTDRQRRIREIVNLSNEQYDQCYGTLSRLMRIDQADVSSEPDHTPLWQNQNELEAHGVKIDNYYYVFAYHFFSIDTSQCDNLDVDASRLSLENTLSDSRQIMDYMRQQAGELSE